MLFLRLETPDKFLRLRTRRHQVPGDPLALQRRSDVLGRFWLPVRAPQLPWPRRPSVAKREPEQRPAGVLPFSPQIVKISPPFKQYTNSNPSGIKRASFQSGISANTGCNTSSAFLTVLRQFKDMMFGYKYISTLLMYRNRIGNPNFPIYKILPSSGVIFSVV